MLALSCNASTIFKHSLKHSLLGIDPRLEKETSIFWKVLLFAKILFNLILTHCKFECFLRMLDQTGSRVWPLPLAHSQFARPSSHPALLLIWTSPIFPFAILLGDEVIQSRNTSHSWLWWQWSFTASAFGWHIWEERFLPPFMDNRQHPFICWFLSKMPPL